jgi:molybdopterin molybdotransferase
MAEFFNVLPPDKARMLMLTHIRPLDHTEIIPTPAALDRVTARPVLAPQYLPSFRRSTMDGFAVRAGDTHGASESFPAFFTVIGEISMGRDTAIALETGQAALVHTGGMIPDSADAVVQVEHTQAVVSIQAGLFPYEIEVLKSVAAGQNVLQIGEDVKLNDEVLPAGQLIRPQDIGGLIALGITKIPVALRPRVTILATGDEIVPPDQIPKPGQIRDINSYTVAGQVAQCGGTPILGGIIADSFEDLLAAATAALADSDMLVMSAGSSVSIRDMTVAVIDQLGSPGVLFHGVATRPGKPTIVGAVEGKPVLGLPGNPVSAMIQFDMFGVPALYHLQGLSGLPQRKRVVARLTQNVPSESGREDYVPARLEPTTEGLIVTPIFGKSNLIFTLISADGIVKVPLNSGGLMAGSQVEVYLF